MQVLGEGLIALATGSNIQMGAAEGIFVLIAASYFAMCTGSFNVTLLRHSLDNYLSVWLILGPIPEAPYGHRRSAALCTHMRDHRIQYKLRDAFSDSLELSILSGCVCGRVVYPSTDSTGTI